MGMRSLIDRGLVSNRAAARAEKTKQLLLDEGGSRSRGEVPRNEIDHPTNQRPKRGSGFTNPQGDYGPADLCDIDSRGNRRTFPTGSGVSAANRNQTNSRAKGPIAPRGGQYGGGGRNTQ